MNQHEKEPLNEEEYVNKLEELIKKDYFPDLYKYEKKSLQIDDDQKKLDGGIDQFLTKFISEDNKSYTELQKSSNQEFRDKFFWKFKHNSNILAIQQDDKQEKKLAIMPDYKKYNQNQFHFAPQLAIKSNYLDDDDDQIIEPKVIKKENTRLPKQYLLNQLENERIQKQKAENDKIIQKGDDDKKKQKRKKKEKLSKKWKDVQTKREVKTGREGLGISKVSDRQMIGLKLQADIARKRQNNKIKQSLQSVSRKSVISQSGKQLLQSIRSNRNLKTPNIFKKY